VGHQYREKRKSLPGGGGEYFDQGDRGEGDLNDRREIQPSERREGENRKRNIHRFEAPLHSSGKMERYLDYTQHSWKKGFFSRRGSTAGKEIKALSPIFPSLRREKDVVG